MDDDKKTDDQNQDDTAPSEDQVSTDSTQDDADDTGSSIEVKVEETIQPEVDTDQPEEADQPDVEADNPDQEDEQPEETQSEESASLVNEEEPESVSEEDIDPSIDLGEDPDFQPKPDNQEQIQQPESVDSAVELETDVVPAASQEEDSTEDVSIAEEDSQSETETETPTEPVSVQQVVQSAKKGNGTLLAVIVAIIVALALVGVGYMAFMSSNKEDDSSSLNQNQELATEQTGDTTSPVDEAAVADQIDEVDKLQSDLDTLDQQIGTDDLSDENLDL